MTPLVAAWFFAQGIPEPHPEFQFAPPRKWAFDFAWPSKNVALEIDGGIWTGGRHVRGKGFLDDMEKLNVAVLLGWRVLRCTPQQFDNGEIFPSLRQALKNRS